MRGFSLVVLLLLVGLISSCFAVPPPGPDDSEVRDFVEANRLARVLSVGFTTYRDQLAYRMLVEGDRRDRALITYYLPDRPGFVDPYPPYLPGEGETWTVTTYRHRGFLRLRLGSLWERGLGSPIGSGRAGEGTLELPSGISGDREPPKGSEGLQPTTEEPLAPEE